MVDVRGTAAAINDRAATAMTDDLKRFLDLVWTHRDEVAETGPGSSGKIYNLYARRPQFAPGATMAVVLPFLKQLQPLSTHPRAQPLGIQGFEDAPDTEVSDLIYWLEYSIAHGTTGSTETGNMLWTCGYTFFHMPCETALPSAGRIYLNVKPSAAVEVMTFVVQTLIANYPEVLKAKLAGPCNVGSDRIVIWVADPDRIDRPLADLAAYQTAHRAQFEDEVPRLCKAVTQAGGKPLHGVGVATEPGGAVSFGKSRTVPIFSAMDTLFGQHPEWRNSRGTQAAEGKAQFISQALEALRAAGIDPIRVHL